MPSIDRLIEALAPIMQDHVTWRRQENAALSRAANNRQLVEVARLARRLCAAGDRAPRELRYRLMGFLQNLGGDAGFALGLALGAEAGGWVAPDLDVFGPAAIAAAAERSIDRRTGPRVDPMLACTLVRLVELYERETGKAFTHSPHKDSVYAGPPQSACGRFVVAVIAAIDPKVRGATLSNHLARIKATGVKVSSIIAGATGERGTNSLIIGPAEMSEASLVP